MTKFLKIRFLKYFAAIELNLPRTENNGSRLRKQLLLGINSRCFTMQLAVSFRTGYVHRLRRKNPRLSRSKFKSSPRDRRGRDEKVALATTISTWLRNNRIKMHTSSGCRLYAPDLKFTIAYYKFFFAIKAHRQERCCIAKM